MINERIENLEKEEYHYPAAHGFITGDVQLYS